MSGGQVAGGSLRRGRYRRSRAICLARAELGELTDGDDANQCRGWRPRVMMPTIFFISGLLCRDLQPAWRGHTREGPLHVRAFTLPHRLRALTVVRGCFRSVCALRHSRPRGCSLLRMVRLGQSRWATHRKTRIWFHSLRASTPLTTQRTVSNVSLVSIRPRFRMADCGVDSDRRFLHKTQGWHAIPL